MFDFYETDHNGRKANMTTKLSLDTLIRIISQETWFYILLTLIAAALVIWVMYKVYSGTCRKTEVNTGFKLLLEVANQETSVYIVLRKFPWQISEYKATVSRRLKEVVLLELFLPKVTVDLSMLLLIDCACNRSYVVGNRYGISYKQMFKLRRQSAPIAYLLAAKSGGQVTRLMVEVVEGTTWREKGDMYG